MCDWSTCNLPVYQNGLCVHHNRIYGIKKKKEPKPIADKSAKRKELEKEYLKLKKQMMTESNKCEAGLNGCTKVAVDLHHTKGRIGALLLDKSNLLRVCRSCHQLIESNPLMALEMGLSKSRHKI